jgi:hypothetical protein
MSSRYVLITADFRTSSCYGVSIDRTHIRRGIMREVVGKRAVLQCRTVAVTKARPAAIAGVALGRSAPVR